MLLDRVRRIVGPVHPHARVRRSRHAVWLVAAACGSIVLTAVTLSHTRVEPLPEVFVQPRPVDFAQEKPAITLEHEIAPVQIELAGVSLPIKSAVVTPVEEAISVARPEALDVAPYTPAVSAKPNDAVAAAPTPAAATLAGATIDAPDSASQVAAATSIAPADPGPVQSAPKLVRMVAPEYPDRGFSRPHAKVSFEFSIDRAGRVRNIRTISGDLQSPFVVVARNALRQWRFDPQSLAARSDEKFHQDFEFVGDSGAAGVADEGSCATPMGSHVCRAGHPLGQARKAEERVAATTQAERVAARKVVATDVCIPEIGSHVCRSAGGSGPAPRVPELEPTLKETSFLAGGAN